MSWGKDYDDALKFAVSSTTVSSSVIATTSSTTSSFADTKEEDALEPVRTNISDAIAALTANPPKVALALQELRATKGKIAKGSMVGRKIVVIPGSPPK